MTLKHGIKKEYWSPDSNLGTKKHDKSGPVIIIDDFKKTVKQIIRNSKKTQLIIQNCNDDALKGELMNCTF